MIMAGFHRTLKYFQTIIYNNEDSFMIQVLIVDDHTLVRSGISQLLSSEKNIEVIGEAESGEEAVKLASELMPTVILMDIKMPGIGGLEATIRIMRKHPDIRILVLTSVTSSIYTNRLFQAGALGYVTKNAPAEQLITAIKKVASGQRYITPELASQMVSNNLDGKGDSPFDRLSKRELQVTLQIIRGEKSKSVASEHHIATKTVNSYRYRAFDKLGIKNNVQLALLAIQHDLLEADEVNLADYAEE